MKTKILIAFFLLCILCMSTVSAGESKNLPDLNAPCMGGTWACEGEVSFSDSDIRLKLSVTLSFTPNHEFKEIVVMDGDGVSYMDIVNGKWETRDGIWYVLTPVESLKGLKDTTPVTATYHPNNCTVALPLKSGNDLILFQCDVKLTKVPSSP